jgi:hypothetical protein
MLVPALAVLAASVETGAQTTTPATPTPASKPTPPTVSKISGTLECGRPEVTKMEVGDAPRHVLSIGKAPCRWTQAIKLGRLKTHAGESKMMRDDRGDIASVRGYHVGHAVNGNAYYFRFDGQVQVRSGAPERLQGRWAFTGGTGELEGLKGQGTYKGISDDEGVAKIEMQGEYWLLPPPAAPGGIE